MNQLHIWSDISFVVLLKRSDYTYLHVAFTLRTQMKIRTLSCSLPFDYFSLPLLFQGFCPPLACVFLPFQWWLLWAHQSEPCQMVSCRQLTATTGEYSVPPRSEGHKEFITLLWRLLNFILLQLENLGRTLLRHHYYKTDQLSSS